jgi:hypothetical protein
MSEEWIRPRDEPEVTRGKGRRHVSWCNAAVHDAPWTDGDTTTSGGIFVALEIAEQVFQAHLLPYEPGLSNMHKYDPRRFTWFYDPTGEAADCVKVRDDETGRVAIWPHFG